MRAMILAAGRGQRMQSLTDNCPKPLLKVAGRYLIEYALLSLRENGISEIVINVSYHAEKIKQALGDGKKWQVSIEYSEEPVALETGGGIFQALPLLSDPFIVLSSDIISHFPLKQLPQNLTSLAHLVLVDNPPYHPRGDFGLYENQVLLGSTKTFTFANIGIYQKKLFANCKPGFFRLGEILETAIKQKKITGEHYAGLWYNIGTPEDLEIYSNKTG